MCQLWQNDYNRAKAITHMTTESERLALLRELQADHEANEKYFKLLQTLMPNLTGSTIIIESTPNSDKGFFSKLFQGPQMIVSYENDVQPHFGWMMKTEPNLADSEGLIKCPLCGKSHTMKSFGACMR